MTSDIGTAFCFGWTRWDLYCNVDRFPPPNSGLEVSAVRQEVGGDAALVGLCCARLGVQVLLSGNAIATDERGLAIASECDRNAITRLNAITAVRTPSNIVIQDAEGNRTWFGLEGEEARRTSVEADLSGLADAGVVYIDGYLGEASRRVIAESTALGKPIVLNLGERDLRDSATVSILPEHVTLPDPLEMLRSVARTCGQGIQIVTCGSRGAYVVSCGEVWHIGSYRTRPTTPSGAGAAFAAGVCLSLMQQRPLKVLAATAAACGALYCGSGGLSGLTRSALDRLLASPTAWTKVEV